MTQIVFFLQILKWDITQFISELEWRNTTIKQEEKLLSKKCVIPYFPHLLYST